jgi:DNA-binding MarR family transcriptional regulator
MPTSTLAALGSSHSDTAVCSEVLTEPVSHLLHAVVSTVVAGGLVDRIQDPTDGCATVVHLTKAGDAALRDQRQLIVGQLDSYFEALSDMDAAVPRRSVELMRELVDVAEAASSS